MERGKELEGRGSEGRNENGGFGYNALLDAFGRGHGEEEEVLGGWGRIEERWRGTRKRQRIGGNMKESETL